MNFHHHQPSYAVAGRNSIALGEYEGAPHLPALIYQETRFAPGAP